MSNVKICNVFHNKRSCLDNLHMLQCSLFYSSSYLLGVNFLLLLCLVYFCFEILYESSNCRCFVFVEFFIHFSISHWQWDLMLLISFLLFCSCYMGFAVTVTWIIIWTILSYIFWLLFFVGTFSWFNVFVLGTGWHAVFALVFCLIT